MSNEDEEEQTQFFAHQTEELDIKAYSDKQPTKTYPNNQDTSGYEYTLNQSSETPPNNSHTWQQQ